MLLPSVTNAGAPLVIPRSAAAAVAVGVAVLQTENSEVLPAESVAVAVITSPVAKDDGFSEVLNTPPLMPDRDPINVLPSPLPEVSQPIKPLLKNSIVNGAAPPVASKVPLMVCVSSAAT